MMVFQITHRYVFFLSLLIGLPFCVYSDPYLKAPCYVNSSTDAIKKGVINQRALRENSSVDKSCKKYKKLSYYLYIEDFANSFIQIPTSNVSVDSSTVASSYLAGRAPIYNEKNEKVGTCSASFLCMQNADGIYTDISNYLSVDNGLIVSWFTPTKLINLELDSIIHSMVTECIVKASTKIGYNPFYGKSFNLIVSSDDQRIYFKFYKI